MAATPTTLIEYLQQANANPLMDTDVKWRQFVSDHKITLRSSCTQLVPTNELLTQCNYNISRYLRMCGISSVFKWIVIMINDIDSDMAFAIDRVPTVIYIPTQAGVTKLYQSYQTSILPNG